MRGAELVGEILGNYRLVECLGGGVTSSVYKAQHTMIQGRIAAVKVFHEVPTDKTTLDRFQHEANLLEQLNHPSIPRIFDASYDPQRGVYFIAMEFIDGTDLERWLKERKGTVSSKEAIRMLRPLCDALDYAHSKGILHLDIKPANVLIGSATRNTRRGRPRRENRPYLADFGFAVLKAEALEGKGEWQGTHKYIAPERIRMQRASERSDLYSLGILAFELLTGRTPFDHADPAQVIRNHLSAPPPAPTKINTKLPMSVDAIFQRVLDKDPNQRHTSAMEFWRELSRALKGAKLVHLPRARREASAGSTPELVDKKQLKARSHSFYRPDVDVQPGQWAWPQVYQGLNKVAADILESRFEPDYIVAIHDPEFPGGNIVASHLFSILHSVSPRLASKLLNEIGIVRIEGRTGATRRVVSLPRVPIHVKSLLLVDDISFTGNTIRLAASALRQHRSDLEVRSASLVIGEQLKNSLTDGSKTHFYAFVYHGREVQFPWGMVTPTGELREYFNLPSGDVRHVSTGSRPWGMYEEFALNETCTVRILTIFPNQRLSLQRHSKRDEFFVALDDGIILQIGDKVRNVSKGDYILIPRGLSHRIASASDGPVRTLEVSFGEYDQVGDIERLEDDYNRPRNDGSV